MTTSVDPLGELVDGRYRVDAVLARGGMATVYRATDERLDRPVALKVLRADLAEDPARVAAFVAEARAAARLQHPNVVNVFDQGSDGGRVFLAMELVNGRTLRDLIRDEAPLTVRRTLDLVEPLLEGLAHAHRTGLAHCDVKPENVLLGGHDGRTVKVADLGLARAVAEGSGGDGEVLWGTAAYLAPEQLRHGGGDARSDVWSAALVLLELLTGTKAYPGTDERQVVSDRVGATVPRASDLVPTVPQELDELIVRCTAALPARRPADAADMLADLRRVRAHLTPEQLDTRPPRTDDTQPVPVVVGGGDPTQQVPTGGPGATRQIPVASPVPDDGVFARTSGNRPVRDRPATSPRPSPQRRRSGLTWLLAILLLLVTAAAAGAAWWFTDGPGNHSPMPRVVNLTEDQARAALDARDLDTVITLGYSEKVPAGRVIRADHAPGTSLKHGTDVTLTVSRGAERYAVPQLRGRTLEQARADLEAAHLTLGAQNPQTDESLPAGQVVGTAPNAGEQVSPGTPVDVLVSTGPASVQVPSVVGTPQTQATEQLSAAGFVVTVDPQPQHDPDVPEGSVLRQDPASGSLARGSTVTLVISAGPELVDVPDVRGQQPDQAQAALDAAGLRSRVEEVPRGLFDTGPADVVDDQSVEPGTQVPVDSEVVLRVLREG